jgi:ABC-2 type transport system permease protein
VHKFRLIARREYSTNVRRRSFLLVTFGMPVLILALLALSIFASGTSRGKPADVGYVDQSGVLAAKAQDPGFRDFATEAQANAALQSGEITSFYVLSADYRTSGRLELIYWDREPSSPLQEQFDGFLRANLVAGLAPDVAERALDGPSDIVVRSLDGSRQMNGQGLVSLILPFVLGLFFSFGLMNASGYLLRAVSDEKESRTIEVITTSVSPGQLIAGKAVGLVGVALTQVFLWAIVVVGGVAIASLFVEQLAGFVISWSLIALLIAYFVPLFTFAATLMIMLGVVVSDTRQGQQIAGAVSLLFLLPLFFSPLLGSNPDGGFMVALTLFPTTSLLTVALRWAATVVPVWQVIAGWLILAACAAVSMWATPKVFRQGMLRYGQRMTLRSIAAAVRARY